MNKFYTHRCRTCGSIWTDDNPLGPLDCKECAEAIKPHHRRIRK